MVRVSKSAKRLAVLFGVLMLALSAFITAAPDDTRASTAIRSVKTPALQAHVETLVGFGTRHALSTRDDPQRGIGAAERYLVEQFEQIDGVEVELQRVRPLRMMGGARRVRAGWPVTSWWRWPFGLLGMDFGYREPEMYNVIARLPGTDPERLIVVGAHFDSRATGRFDGETDAPGANDNASGTACLLELARVLAPQPRRATVEIVAFTGEELGLLGSRHYASKLVRSGRRVEAMLNNDIIGGARPEVVDPLDDPPGSAVRVFSAGRPTPTRTSPARVYQLSRGPSESDSPSRDLARQIAEIGAVRVPDLKIRLIHRVDRMHRGGDQLPFTRAGFAAVRFSEQHERYDQQHQDVRIENGRQFGDLAEHIDYDYLARVTELNYAVAAELSQAPAPMGPVELKPGLSTATRLSWSRPDDSAIRGFELLARRSEEARWSLRRELGEVSEVEIDLSKDDWWFAVRAIDVDGRRGLPSLATPPR